MKTHVFTLQVRAPDELTADEVQDLLYKLVEVGQSDADDTANDDDMSDEARAHANKAAALEIEIV